MVNSTTARRKEHARQIRNWIREYNSRDGGFDPFQGRGEHRAAQSAMDAYWDYLFSQTTDEEALEWLERTLEREGEKNLLRWLKRKTTRGWPPARSAINRGMRLYILTKILGRPIYTTNDLLAGEAKGLARAMARWIKTTDRVVKEKIVIIPEADDEGQCVWGVDVNTYLLGRALIRTNGALLTEMATLKPLLPPL